MPFVIAGLGNPRENYGKTRHNVGWQALDKFATDFNIDNWHESSKNKGQIAEGKIGKEKITLLKPHTMMNGSGKAVATLVKSKKAAPTPSKKKRVGIPTASVGTENLIVLHDDMDLPLGKFKIVFDRGAGGHRGVKSVGRALGTTAFVRIKIGVSPSASSGKVRKPKGEQKVLDFIIGEFRKPELLKLKKVLKDVSSALESIILDGRQLAQTDWN